MEIKTNLLCNASAAASVLLTKSNEAVPHYAPLAINCQHGNCGKI